MMWWVAWGALLAWFVWKTWRGCWVGRRRDDDELLICDDPSTPPPNVTILQEKWLQAEIAARVDPDTIIVKSAKSWVDSWVDRVTDEELERFKEFRARYFED